MLPRVTAHPPSIGSSGRRPIGVFDSGVGGLTVLKSLHARLPDESTVYLGDTARVPYGTRSPETVIRYALNNARFLMDAAPLKLLVVACNTASAVALPALAEALPVPVLGVVEPGAAAAAAATRTGKVAVIGTRGTVASGAYQRALEARRPGIEVHARACPLLVPLAEEGWHDDAIAREVVARYLEGLRDLDVDALVLGCTHYPLLRGAIADVVGPAVTLIDSGEATAEAVAARLASSGDLAPGGEGPPLRRCFVTDVPEAFHEVASRFLGAEAPPPELVDIPV